MRLTTHPSLRALSLAVSIAPLWLQVGCSSLMFWKDKEEPVETDAAVDAPQPESTKASKRVAAKQASIEELELKLAKTWARVDEMEEEQFRQKEKLRVLEKGLTLGLVPEELKDEAKPVKKGKKKAAENHPVAEADRETPAEVAEAAAKQANVIKTDESAKTSRALTKEEQETFQKLLANAQDQYRAGKYGRAIVELSEINKNFGDDVEGGLPHYWIAKSWIGLKEYNTARQQLLDFIKAHASSPWVPRAKLDLAKVEWRLGMQETSVARFKEIIQTHPYEDAAEMAKMELSNLDKSL